MWEIRKSGLFKKQLSVLAKNYKLRADLIVAEAFLDDVEIAIDFISKFPDACAIYRESSNIEELQHYEFRRWSLKAFPHTVFFRMTDDKVILLEAIYAHRMDIEKWMIAEIEPITQ